MTTLEEAKDFATEFFKRELYMFQKLSELAPNDVALFYDWYETNPFYVKLQELMQIVKKSKLKD